MRPETLAANHLIVSGDGSITTVELLYPLTATIVEVIELTATIVEEVALTATIEVCN